MIPESLVQWGINYGAGVLGGWLLHSYLSRPSAGQVELMNRNIALTIMVQEAAGRLDDEQQESFAATTSERLERALGEQATEIIKKVKGDA